MSNSDERSPCVTSERTAKTEGAAARARRTLLESAGARITADRLAEAARRIGLPIEIDDSGRERARAVLRYVAGLGGTIQSVLICTAPDTTVTELVQLGVPARCTRYNRVIAQLRTLQRRLQALAKRSTLEQGSAVWGAHQRLLTLDDALATRQAQRMTDGTVSVDVLLDEIVYWERYLEHFEKITTRAEQDTER